MVTDTALAPSVAPQAASNPAAAEPNADGFPAAFLLALQSAGAPPSQFSSMPQPFTAGSSDAPSTEDAGQEADASAALPLNFVLEALSTVRALSTLRQADAQPETGSESGAEEATPAAVLAGVQPLVLGAAAPALQSTGTADALSAASGTSASSGEALPHPERVSVQPSAVPADAAPQSALSDGMNASHGSALLQSSESPLNDASRASLQSFARVLESVTGTDSASALQAASAAQGSDASGSAPAAGALATIVEPTVEGAERLLPRELRHMPGTPQWSDELGTQLRWMVREGLETASLRLHPEELGPLEIRIAVQDGDARVWFAAANADTRTAIENALPRLREMLAAEGLVLSDAGVFREPPRDPARGNAPTPARATLDEVHETNVTAVAPSRRGIVDIYA